MELWSSATQEYFNDSPWITKKSLTSIKFSPITYYLKRGVRSLQLIEWRSWVGLSRLSVCVVAIFWKVQKDQLKRKAIHHLIWIYFGFFCASFAVDQICQIIYLQMSFSEFSVSVNMLGLQLKIVAILRCKSKIIAILKSSSEIHHLCPFEIAERLKIKKLFISPKCFNKHEMQQHFGIQSKCIQFLRSWAYICPISSIIPLLKLSFDGFIAWWKLWKRPKDPDGFSHTNLYLRIHLSSSLTFKIICFLFCIT